MQTWSLGKGSNPCMQIVDTEFWLLIRSRWICSFTNIRVHSSRFLAFAAASSFTFAAFLAWPFAFFLDGIALLNRRRIWIIQSSGTAGKGQSSVRDYLALSGHVGPNEESFWSVGGVGVKGMMLCRLENLVASFAAFQFLLYIEHSAPTYSKNTYLYQPKI